MDDTLEGWHFLRADHRTGSGERLLIQPGQTLVLDGKKKPALCKRGFHGSEQPLHALRYAPGFVVERVRYSGKIVLGDDKFCAQERTCLWLADAKPVIIGFVCWAVTGVLLGARRIDPRSWAAIEVVQEWLADRATIEQVRQARIVAYAAAAAAAADAYDADAYADAAAVAYAAAAAAAADAYDADAYAAYDAAAAAADAAVAGRNEARFLLNAELERRLWELAPR